MDSRTSCQNALSTTQSPSSRIVINVTDKLIPKPRKPPRFRNSGENQDSTNELSSSTSTSTSTSTSLSTMIPIPPLIESVSLPSTPTSQSLSFPDQVQRKRSHSHSELPSALSRVRHQVRFQDQFIVSQENSPRHQNNSNLSSLLTSIDQLSRKKEEIKSTLNDLQKKGESTDAIEAKLITVRQEIKEAVELSVKEMQRRNSIQCENSMEQGTTDSEKLLACLEATKKLSIEELCHQLSPYQNLIISHTSPKSSFSLRSRKGLPPPMPIKNCKKFFTSDIIKIPFFKSMLENVNLFLAWRNIPNEDRKIMWDYVRNCFTTVRLFSDLESINLSAHQTRDQKNFEISHLNTQPDMMSQIDKIDRVGRNRGLTFHDPTPQTLPSGHAKFLAELSSKGLSWHICTVGQSQQTIIFPLVHFQLNKVNHNNIMNDLGQHISQDVDAQPLICIILHPGKEKQRGKKSMIGYIVNGKIRYCEYLRKFSKIKYDASLPYLLSLQLHTTKKHPKNHYLVFYCSEHAIQVRTLLELYMKRFSGFKKGQICIHKGYGELIGKDGTPRITYFRLFKYRLMLYPNQTQPLAKGVITLSSNTLRDVKSSALPVIHIQNRFQNQTLECRLKFNSIKERDKWVHALLAEPTLNENWNELAKQPSIKRYTNSVSSKTELTKPKKSLNHHRSFLLMDRTDDFPDARNSLTWMAALRQSRLSTTPNPSDSSKNQALIKKLRGSDGVTVKDRTWRLRKYTACFLGSELVSWLIDHGEAIDRESAIKIGEALQRCGAFDHVTGEQHFRDGHFFYQFTHDALRGKKEEVINSVTSPMKYKDEARKLIKSYFGSENLQNLETKGEKFWYKRLWKDATNNESVFIGLLILEQEGSKENLALMSKSNGKKIQLTITTVVDTILRNHTPYLKERIEKILNEKISKDNVNGEMNVTIWYRLPQFLDKGDSFKITLSVKSGTTIEKVLHQALVSAKLEIALEECAFTMVDSQTHISNTDIIDTIIENNGMLCLIQARSEDSEIKMDQRLLQVIKLDMDASAFFSFLLSFRQFDIVHSTDIPCLSNWLKMTKSNLFNTRKKKMKSLDQALEFYTEYTRVGRKQLMDCRLTCLDSNIQSSSSQIAFAFPGFDSQIFDVGRYSCICPWYMLCGSDSLSYGKSEVNGSFKSSYLVKELMQASPDVSKLYQTDIAEAKRVMQDAQAMVLHNIYLSAYLQQHSKHSGKDLLASDNIIPWSTVVSQFQSERNRKHLESWGHLSYVFNPTIKKFLAILQSSLVLTLPQMKYEDDNSDLEGRKSDVRIDVPRNNNYENIRLLLSPLYFLLILRLIMEARNNALDNLSNQVKIWLEANRNSQKDKDHVYDAVQELNEKVMYDAERFDILLDTIPDTSNLKAASNALHLMNSASIIKQFLHDRPEKQILAVKGIIQSSKQFHHEAPKNDPQEMTEDFIGEE